MFFGLFSKRPKSIPEFWSWFTSNEERLFALASDPLALFNELQRNSKSVAPDLMFEVSEPGPDGRRDLVISADGIRERIPLVQSIIAAAPRSKRWNLIAFRQRSPEGLCIQMGDIKLDPATMETSIAAQDGKIGIVIYAPNDDPALVEAMTGPMLLLLDAMIGEYDMMTKVGALDVLPRSAEVGLKRFPLADLPARFDLLFATASN